MTNDRTLDEIVNYTFEEIDAFSKLLIICEILKTRKIEPAMQNMFFSFFLCVNRSHINAL